ncbi:MAG: ATP-binding protein, partial [Gaiellaceae bacterium]
IAEHLDDRFRLLTGGSRSALPRQQTLRATIDWSYQLLEEPERVCLRRLSVFAGSFTLEAAEAVCAGEGIESYELLDLVAGLVLRSLVLAERDGGQARYRLLETIHENAAERLVESGETATLRGRHREFFLALAESAPTWSGAGEEVWLERMEADHDNLRAALQSGGYEDRADEAHLRLAAAAWRFWEVHAYRSEGRGWLEPAVAASAEAPAPLRAKLLMGAGAIIGWLSDFEESLAYQERSLALYRQLGDTAGVGLSLSYLGIRAGYLGEYREATKLFEESLAYSRASGDKALIACQLADLANLACLEGDLARGLLSRGLVACRQGHDEQAAALQREALELAREVGDRGCIAWCLAGLGTLAAAAGQPERAVRLLAAAELLRDSIGGPLHPIDQREYESVAAAVRAELGAERFASVRAEGQAMALEQAVAYALEQQTHDRSATQS